MEVPVVVYARKHGAAIKRRQEEQQQQPDNDEEQQHTGSSKRLRASGEEDLQGTAAAPSSCSGSTALSSPGDSAGEVVLPCRGDEGALQAQGVPKTTIVDESNDEEVQSELEFEKEMVLIRAEIARLEALVERLESQAGRK